MGSFDFTFIEALMSIGVPRESAQSLARQLEQTIDERYSLHAQVLATKRDLADLELKLTSMIGQSNDRISRCEDRISQCNERISECNERISECNRRISRCDERIAQSNDRISQSNERISQTNERISQTNERISSLETTLRTELSRNSVAIAESKSELIKWMLGSLLALGALLIAAMRLMH